MIISCKLSDSKLSKCSLDSIRKAFNDYNELSDNDRLGCLDHNDSLLMDTFKISHRVNNVTFEHDNISTDISILNTTEGRVAEALVYEFGESILKPDIVGFIENDEIHILRMDLVIDENRLK